MVSVGKTYIAYLGKKQFERIKDRMYKKEMQEQITFLKNVEQLSHLSKRILNRLYFQMKIKKFKRRQMLIKEGDLPSYVFIV